MTQNTKTETVQAADTMSDAEREILAQLGAWEKVETGFVPYWKPEVGRILVARVCALDTRQEGFTRIVLQATRLPVTCARGPVDGGEEVIVQPGDFFSMGEYASLDMSKFFDIEVFIKVTGTRKLPGNEASNGVPRKLFEFDVRCSPEDKKRLNADRAEEMKMMASRRTIASRGETQQITLA